MRSPWPGDRAVTPVVANILIAAVVVVLAVTVTLLGFALLEGFGTPTADASFKFEQTSAGLRIIPSVLGTDVDVRLNGDTIATIEEGSAGSGVLLPTAPGDRITVVSTDGEKSLLLDRTVDDRNEVGDFIAYYSFAAGSGSNVSDRSGNGNDGGVNGGATWISDESGTALDFDGSSGTYVDVGDLTADGPSSVEELTIAITYEHDDGSGIQNLIEHQDSNFAWYIETRDEFGKPHKMEYNIGYNNPPSAKIRTGNVPSNETQVLIGTYDGTEMVLYRNGNRIGSESLDREVALGEVILGADSDPNTVGQNFDGRIYEVRLYYTAFDADEVAVITEAMS